MRFVVLLLILALCALAAVAGAYDDAPGLVLAALLVSAAAVIMTARGVLRDRRS